MGPDEISKGRAAGHSKVHTKLFSTKTNVNNKDGVFTELNTQQPNYLESEAIHFYRLTSVSILGKINSNQQPHRYYFIVFLHVSFYKDHSL